MYKHLQTKFLALLAIMLMGGSNAWADVSTLTFTAKCNGSGTADDGVAWTVTSDGTESTFDSTKGIHYGTNSAQVTYIKLSTSGISGTITKVVVNASTASGVSATASVTVGGAAFGGEAQSLSATATDYTFEGSASGAIEVTVTKPSKATKALYVKSIAVTYSTGGGDPTPTVAAPTFSPAAGEVDYGTNITLTQANAHAIVFTTNGDTPSWNNNVGTIYSNTQKPVIQSDMTVKAIAVAQDGDNFIESEVVSVTYTVKRPAAPTFSPAAGAVEAGTQVTISGTGRIIVYTTDGSTPSYGDHGEVYTDPITVNEAMTIKAIVVDSHDFESEVSTASYTIYDPNAPGTENNPYTVAQARAAIDAGSGTSNVYATGIVSEIVTAYNSQYGNITYNISADGTTTADQLEVYRGKSYNGANFTSADDIQVGDVVVVYGTLQKYGNTYEFAQDNQLVSLQRPVITTPSISLSETTINATAEEAIGTIDVTYNNITNVAAEVVFYEEGGETTTSYDWITADINNDNDVDYIIEANTGEARTAYMKVWAYDDDLNEVYSDLITITQAAPVIDYATLPFSWEGGAKADFLALNGVTSYGLGSDYAANNAPYLIKLDNTGDYIQVKTDSQPGEVTIGVKMIGGGNTSTITVQGSADGNTFTDVEALTISGDQNDVLTLKTTNSFAATDRYVRLLFTKGSNVGVGPIKIAQYVEPSHNPVIISDAGMATLSSENALDFTNVTTIEAYYATLDNSGNVAYHRIRKVPAETGLLIRNAAGEAQGAVSADVPTLTETAESVEGNILVAALDAITGLQSESDGYKNYILNKHSQYGLGFYLANGKNLAANRAYMRIPVQTAREFIGINFDGDATGIESIRLNGADDAIYDLQGRKVMNPAKGLYIVNGKKVVVK